MPVARRLAVALLLCSWSVLAQDKQSLSNPSPTAPVAQNNLSHFLADGGFQPVPLDANLDKGAVISLDTDGWGEGVCYTMRSYVVARDSKTSDSVHPVRYSTCQMGSQYRLKSVQAQPVPSQR
jgi:hypothetical protein